ncbi:hypothetical protein AXG93_441s1000 [Marchantia polymorpha subsp. ruderalis]|uniref:Uncharacterized protein n=1 Tax=Marchantia polymorpha subsp. ruderalis TaxID=1480154 RepID=A0A176W2T4_MARPO|nr:hypothetical protein AXG93_441s1000 [Marchantia polymorpha subsp. ruderalis]
MEGAVAPNVSSSSSVGVEERLEGAVASNVSSSSSVGVEERLEGAVAPNVSSSSSVGVGERLEGAIASNVSSSVGVEERLEGAVASNVSSSSSVGVEERMEVAGASIVSHDAETRGMDSAHQEPETSYVSEKDEEPELPSAVQDLIRRLEDTTAYAPTLHIRDPGFLEFFPESASLSTITGWRSKVRLRVLEAIALRIARYSYLSLNFSCEGDISRFTASEWEVLLRGCNGLQTMRVAALKWSSDAEVESLCLQLGRIVNSSEVKELEIEDLDCKMTARCFLNLASGLRGNYDSKLESLKLTNTRVDSSGMKHVVDMINGAPLLKTLHLGGQKCDVNDEYEETVGMLDDMDEETVGMLSQALIRSSSLKELRLSDVKWGAALSLKALAGDDGNRSIEILRLDYMDILGDCLRQLLTSDASLKAVNLCSIRMSYEEWHQLGEFIRDNAIAKRIFVSFELEHNARDNWRSIEALACAASSHVKEPMSFWLVAHSDHDFLLSLNLLVRVLRGEIKSFTSFGISGLPLVTLDSNQDRIGRILSMNGKTGETSVLQKLMIFRNENLSKGAWKKLLGCLLGCLRGNTSLTHLALHNSKLDEDAFRALIGYLRGNTSITHLDLKRSELNEDSFRDLMGLLQVNLTLQKIDVKGTSWETDGKAAQIKEALQQNQMRAVYMSVFREAKLEFGDAKAGRLFLCGSPRADPNWLTNTLLGELVALGQDFQAEESGCSRKTMPSDLYTSMDGFVSESVFARLTEEFVSKQPHAEKIVDREVIENILINLDLCFKLKDTSEYFIPSFIPEHMFMRRKVILEMHVSKETVICSRHYLRLFLDGHEIHVEQDRSHSYVDVLMLCSKYKSREWALKYVMKHIVQELISFCASPKGCPGVALVLGVIQTICVEMLIPSHLRGAILIEDLKSKFIRSINDKLEDIPLDKSHLEKEDELFNYEHSWPLIKGHTTRVIFERARELLRESDVEIVVNEILQNRLQQLESLQQGLISVNDDLVHSHPEDENMASNSNFPDMKDFNRTSSRCLSGASTSVENRSTQLILSKIDMLEGNMGRRFDGVDEGLRSVESIVQRLDIKVGQILSLQQELHSTLSIFLSKVDRIIQYTQSLQQAIIPKRPYVTDDVGVFCRMSARLHVGTTVRLHLMCESVTGFHIVKDQQGLKIRLDQENGAWIRKTIEISLKVMYYVVKAGLDVTLGLGQAIPDWADLKSDIVKLDGISNRDRRAVLKGGESKELKEAWLRIQQTLAPINYSAIFKLYQVKYVRLELGGHAWVCEECMNKGRGLGI